MVEKQGQYCMKMASLLLTLGGLFAIGAQAASQQSSSAVKASAVSGSQQEGPWFSGTVDEAFEKSKKENKPVFLYWGAVWCPPCAEIKAEVFSKQRFQELMQLAIPVYLDGDSTAAQIWGEKLRVSGYPTLVLIAPSGKEVMRFNENVNIDEFEVAFENAVKSSRPFSETLSRALAGRATNDDWKIIGQFSWSDATSTGFKANEVLAKRIELIEKVPSNLKAEKALLSGQLLEVAASSADDSDPLVKKSVAAVFANREKYFNAMFATPQSIVGARSTLVYMTSDVFKWAYPNLKDKARQKTRKRWLAATKQLQANQKIPLDNWLWSHSAELEFYKMDHEAAGSEKQAIPADLRNRIQTAVKISMKAATSHYVRHSVLSGAAELLDEAGDEAGARALLAEELKTTETPWYYESSMARIARKHGNLRESLEWSGKAAASVKGNGSRLEWIAADALFALKNATALKLSDDELVTRVKNYYDLATTLPDGFAGRNLSRQKRLAAELKPFAQKEKFRALLNDKSTGCKTLPTESKTNCETHFASFATM